MSFMRILTITFGLLFCINVFSQKGGESVCKWNGSGNKELNIPLESYQYFKKSMLYHYLSNDKENVYLDIRVIESIAKSKMLKEGMTVWINMDNKQIKKNGIRFPLGTENPRGPGRQQARDAQGRLLSPVEQANTIQLIGFGGTFQFLPANETEGFRGSVHYDNEGVLIYRLIIPITKLTTGGTAITGPFAIAIEPGPFMPDINQIQKPATPSEGMTGTMGGRPGGGRPGGGRSGGAPPGGQMPASTVRAPAQNAILWIKKISLASE
jgi:hypothetical protein